MYHELKSSNNFQKRIMSFLVNSQSKFHSRKGVEFTLGIHAYKRNYKRI